MINVSQHLNGMAATLDLKKGKGTIEAIFSIVMLVIAVFAMMYDSNEVPRWVIGTISTIVGYYFGTKNTENGIEK